MNTLPNGVRLAREIIEAVKRVEERKEQEAEAKSEEQARQDKTDTKVFLTDSLVKVMNNSKPFRNQAE